MPAAEITRNETAERARILEVRSYQVTLDLTRGEQLFGSTSQVRFSCREPGADSYIDIIAEQVREIRLNGTALDPAAAWSDGRIALTGLAEDNELTVVTDCRYSRDGTGLHRAVDPADQKIYTYTKFEPAYARTVYANFEQPDLKAGFEISVVAPAHWTVLSNEPLAERLAVAPDSVCWRFAATPRLSTYLFAIAAGDYEVVRATHTTPSGQVIPLGLACRASMAASLDAEDILDTTRKGLDYYTALFRTPYPFTKYDQVFVPEYSVGATENAGCVVLTDQLLFRSHVTQTMYQLRASIILHEMAHMWFGDLVTMKWWDDLWLNESFAEFCAALASAEASGYTEAWATFQSGRKAWGYGQDQLPSAHPVAADVGTLSEAIANFDGISYAKGASVLRQLVALIGRDSFFAGITAYLAEYSWGNATLSDWLQALSASSAMDLTAWSRAWLQTAGPSTLRPEFSVDGNGAFATFAVSQEVPRRWPVFRPHRIAIGLYDRDKSSGELSRTRQVLADIDGPRTQIGELSGIAAPDLVLLNDDDLSYALVRFDDRSVATLTQSVGALTDPLARAVCWGAVLDMARQAELAVPTVIAMAAGALATERSVAALQLLLDSCRDLLRTLAAPLTARQGAEALAAEAIPLLRAAEPGGDHQLAWTQLLAWSATSADQLALIGGLLDGSTVPAGLVVSTELRWAVLQRLAAAGLTRDADIEAELAGDQSDAGRRNAAACRAAIGDEEHKAAAWQQLTEPADISADLLRAMAAAFYQQDQADLLAPYCDRYFEVLPAMWSRSGGHLRVTRAVALFPVTAAGQELIDSIDGFLAASDREPGLVRVLAEQRDLVVRALRSRALGR